METLFGYPIPTCAHGRAADSCPFCVQDFSQKPESARRYSGNHDLSAYSMHGTPPFVHHSQESQDAALSVSPKAPSLRERVYRLLQTETLTDEGIAAKLNLNPNTSRPRRVELANMGLIEPAGTALTAAKRSAVLWRAVPTKTDS